MQHKVSIVIPVYNVKQYLDECVNSAINQTYQNIEILLVDDGSTDGSGELCDAYQEKDARIKVFHKENGGLSDARNYGMDRAEGTYIYFLDSDDLIEPYAMEILLQTAVKNDAEVVLFDARVIDENSVPQMDVSSYMWYYRIGEYGGCQKGKELFAKLEKNKEYRSAIPLLFIKKDAIKNRFVPIIHEDELFTLQLLYGTERAVYHPEVLYIRRVRAGSITTIRKTPKNYRGIQTVMFEFSKVPEFDKAAARYMYRLYARQQVTYHNLPADEKRSVRSEKKALDAFVAKNRFFGNQKLKRSYYKWKVPFYPLIGNKLELKLGKYFDKIKLYHSYQKKLKKIQSLTSGKRVFVIGTPCHGNLGDHAIAIAEERFIGEALPGYTYVEIEMPFYRKCKDKLKKIVRPEDLIVVSGGGWMGNQWFHNEVVIREIVQAYQENAVMIFPQTIYYEPSEETEKMIADARKIYGAHPNLLLCLRDEKSYLFAKENGFGSCIYVPDIALFEKRDDFGLPREDVLFCIRYDREKSVPETLWEELRTFVQEQGKGVRYTTTIIGKVSPDKRESAFSKKLLEFSRAKLIVTDRLHAMIFAAVTGTPCVAFDNTSKKVSGVYQWLTELPYITCVEEAEKAREAIREMLKIDDASLNYHKPDFEELKRMLISMSETNKKV